MTATEDDSGTESAEEYGDASDGIGAPTRLESRVPRERAKKPAIEEGPLGETLPLNLGTKITDSSTLDMMILDDSSL